MLSVRAALSLVSPPRAPSLRTVSAAGLSDLTRFLITRCGLMVLQIGVGNGQLLENATAPLVADFGFPFLRLMLSRAGSEGSFWGSTRTYFRRYFGGPRHYSRRMVRELVRYLAASVNSDCCRRWSSPPPSPSTFHFRLRQAGVLGGGGGCEQILGAMWVD